MQFHDMTYKCSTLPASSLQEEQHAAHKSEGGSGMLMSALKHCMQVAALLGPKTASDLAKPEKKTKEPKVQCPCRDMPASRSKFCSSNICKASAHMLPL